MDIIIAILTITGIVLALYWGGAGAKSAAGWLSSSDDLPEGVERVKLKKRFYRHGLIFVKYAWYFKWYNDYSATIQCSYVDCEKRVEAKSLDELTHKIEQAVADINSLIDAKNNR